LDCSQNLQSRGAGGSYFERNPATYLEIDTDLVKVTPLKSNKQLKKLQIKAERDQIATSSINNINQNLTSKKIFRSMKNNQFIKTIRKLEYVEVAAFDNTTLTDTNLVEITFDMKFGNRENETTIEMRAIVLDELSHDLIIGTNFHQDFQISLLNINRYIKMYQNNQSEKIFSENSDKTTEKILITKINLNTYIGKTVIRPEGVYFWDNINGQWIMKMLRYEGKKYRKIQLGIKKENENQPVLVIPKEWGRRLAYSKHKEYNHIQANKLYALLKKDYEWKEMMLEISWIVESCQACQKTTHNLMAHGSYQAIIPRRVNDVVAIDLAVMPLSYDGYRYIMNIIDLMSRHVIAIPLKRRDQISIKNAFLKGYLCKFGRPRKLLVDQGGEFTNQLFRDLSTFAKIDVRYTD